MIYVDGSGFEIKIPVDESSGRFPDDNPKPKIKGEPKAEAGCDGDGGHENEGRLVEMHDPPSQDRPEPTPENGPHQHGPVKSPEFPIIDEMIGMTRHPESSIRTRRARRARERIARLQGSLISRWQDDLREVIGLMTDELKRYRRGYEADFRGVWKPCPVAELESALAGADMILSGDYHTLPASQRLLIRLLRRLLPRDNRPATLALEMLHSTDQPLIDRYLAGRMGLEALREAIAFDRRWGFDWRHYGALLRFARDRGLGVLAINFEPGVARGRLHKRDEHAASLMVDCWQLAPHGRIHLLAGDWHVARAHLPRLIRAEAAARGLKPRVLVIHQNHERLHATLARPAGAPAVARRGRDLFCVLNTTPLIKADSNRLWASRQPGAMADTDTMESGDWPLFDPTLAFQEVDEILTRHLHLKPAPPFDIIGRDDEAAIKRTARLAGAGADRLASWRRRLGDGGLVWVPHPRTLLLGHVPIHRLAEEVIRRRLELPPVRPQLRLVRLDRISNGIIRHGAFDTRSARFHRRLRVEGAAFFASRLVNPDRKCRLFADWSARTHGLTGGWVRTWIRSAQRHPWQLPFSDPDHPFWAIRASTRRDVARAVGAAWGWHLFQTWAAGLLPWTDLAKLFDPAADRSADLQTVLIGIRAWPDDVDQTSKESLL